MATKKSEPGEQRRCGPTGNIRIAACVAATSLAAGLLFACGTNTPRAKPSEAIANATATVAVQAPRPPTSSTTSDVPDGRCEPASCDYRAETCCEREVAHRMSGCVSKSAMPRPEEKTHRCYGERAADWIGIECLSTEDCSGGLRCCATQGEGGGLNHCATECEAAEACTPGSKETCHQGSRCEPSSSARSGGYCVVASPSTACGERRCSGSTAGCRYDRRTRKGECVALTPFGGWPDDPAQPLTADLALLQCASPDDCAGERCCTGGPLPMTQCTGMCMSGIDVCDTVQDCPHFLGPPTGCKADPEGPPFLKTCRYGTEP